MRSVIKTGAFDDQMRMKGQEAVGDQIRKARFIVFAGAAIHMQICLMGIRASIDVISYQ